MEMGMVMEMDNEMVTEMEMEMEMAVEMEMAFTGQDDSYITGFLITGSGSYVYTNYTDFQVQCTHDSRELSRSHQPS